MQMVENERVSKIDRYNVSSEAVRMLPLDFCFEKHAVVLRQADKSNNKAVLVGMLHPDSSKSVDAIENKLDEQIETVQINAYELKKALSTGYDVTTLKLDRIPTLVLDNDYEISFNDPQPPTKLLRDLLSVAVNRKASDVHIECYSGEVAVRFRIDGVLEKIKNPLSLENVQRVISKLKVMSDLDITEHRHAQDGHFRVSYFREKKSRPIDFRINIIPGSHGEEAALRILDSQQFILDFERLGLNETQLNNYQDLLDIPSGMLLTVGPAGCGKTTTLYCSIVEMMHEEKKIITAEDPVEYEFDRVSQKQVSSNMDFSDYTRAFLRQDPDIIMIGEIRDEITADNCIRAGNTGHLVLSTLHTGDAIMAISRLRSLGVDDDYLAEVLNGVIGQRLVRILCENCKSEAEAPEKLLNKFYDHPPDHLFYEAEGCEKCAGKGFKGRTGVFEILLIDKEIRELIAAGETTENIRNHVQKKSFESMDDHALEKVADGVTSLQEVARVLTPPKLF